ncbi:KICSTOR complex protein ITFG2 [Hondaea fermentalgiana]|uniref:KICSTOR complex protein ITFG2 n=1 Tax=Hondaea fermentalgiana TaxID=2315210 RepID=A0A2R5GF76_9STRA|nr:KICSTOR complex protein ITFG2 [Hondaea fermentalgiana]|eukprot:GBG26891.1 KICSTOR complex protein ITFG2 [Hondaea fermentalgiana]
MNRRKHKVSKHDKAHVEETFDQRQVSLVERVEVPFEGSLLPAACALGDVDGDGDQELVVGNCDGKLFVYKHGALHATYNDLGTIVAVFVRNDFARKGAADIVVMNGEGSCHVLAAPAASAPRVSETLKLESIAIFDIPWNVTCAHFCDLFERGQELLVLASSHGGLISETTINAYRVQTSTLRRSGVPRRGLNVVIEWPVPGAAMSMSHIKLPNTKGKLILVGLQFGGIVSLTADGGVFRHHFDDLEKRTADNPPFSHVVLNVRERAFWAQALARDPITPEFDRAPASEIVQTLQHRIRIDTSSAEEENKFWAQLGQLVRQAQEARKLVRRLDLTLPHKTRQETLHQLPPQDVRVESERDLVPDVAPPSPVRNAHKPGFCAKNVKATLEAMKRHKTNSRIQEQGCRALVELIKDGKKKRKQQAQDPEGSWSCAACHFRNRPKDHACRICTGTAKAKTWHEIGDTFRPEDSTTNDGDTMPGASPSKVPECQQVLDNAGIPSIIYAMRAFGSSERVLRVACYALAQLVQEDASAVQRIAAAGGIAEILAAMQVLCTDREVQTQCMGILASPELAADEVVRIDTEHFASVVCQSLWRYPKAMRLQALGFLALANLGMKSDAATNLLVCDPRFLAHQRVIRLLHAEAEHKPASAAQNMHTVTSGLVLLERLGVSFQEEVSLQDGETTCLLQ